MSQLDIFENLEPLEPLESLEQFGSISSVIDFVEQSDKLCPPSLFNSARSFNASELFEPINWTRSD